MPTRCAWAGADPLYVRYHDAAWGVSQHDDRRLFEMLVLEGAQAGLSWITILRKRRNYRNAFDRFDAPKIARYTAADRRRLLADAGIVRNRLKVDATIANARAFLEVKHEFGRFDRYIWEFVDGTPKVNRWRSMSRVPPRTTASDAMSRDLKRRGFKFVGPTVCYAFMQATGAWSTTIYSDVSGTDRSDSRKANVGPRATTARPPACCDGWQGPLGRAAC